MEEITDIQVDELGVPIKKAKPAVDELGVPIKKKTQSSGSDTTQISLEESASPSTEGVTPKYQYQWSDSKPLKTASIAPHPEVPKSKVQTVVAHTSQAAMQNPNLYVSSPNAKVNREQYISSLSLTPEEKDKALAEFDNQAEVLNSLKTTFDEVKKDPNNPDTQIKLVDGMLKLNQPVEADKKADEIIARFPDYSPAYNYKASIEAKNGNYAFAVDVLNKGIAVNPLDASLYNNRGAVKSQAGDLSGAIRDLDMAADNTKNPHLLENIWTQKATIFNKLQQDKTLVQKYIETLDGTNTEHDGTDQEFFNQKYIEAFNEANKYATINNTEKKKEETPKYQWNSADKKLEVATPAVNAGETTSEVSQPSEGGGNEQRHIQAQAELTNKIVNPDKPLTNYVLEYAQEHGGQVVEGVKQVGGGLKHGGASGLVDVFLGTAKSVMGAASLAVPEMVGFNVVASSAPEELNKWAFAPATSIAEQIGYKPKKDSGADKLLQTSDIIISLIAMHKLAGGKEIKGLDVAEEKLRNGETLTQEDSAPISEVLNEQGTSENIHDAAKAIVESAPDSFEKIQYEPTTDKELYAEKASALKSMLAEKRPDLKEAIDKQDTKTMISEMDKRGYAPNAAGIEKYFDKVDIGEIKQPVLSEVEQKRFDELIKTDEDLLNNADTKELAALKLKKDGATAESLVTESVSDTVSPIENKVAPKEEIEVDKPSVEKPSYDSVDKKYSVENVGGELRVADKKGEVPSDNTKLRVTKEYEDNYDYSKGATAEDAIAKEGIEVSNPKDLARVVADKSSNPLEIVKAYQEAAGHIDEKSYKNQIIDDYATRIDPKSYTRFGDANNIGATMAKRFFAKAGEKGKQLDTLAQEISETAGVEVTPADIVDFMENDKYQRKVSPEQQLLADKFKKVTGLTLNSRTIDKAITGELAKHNKDYANYLTTEGKSFEDAKQQYEQAIYRGDIPESSHEQTGTTERVSEDKKAEALSENELAAIKDIENGKRVFVVDEATETPYELKTPDDVKNAQVNFGGEFHTFTKEEVAKNLNESDIVQYSDLGKEKQVGEAKTEIPNISNHVVKDGDDIVVNFSGKKIEGKVIGVGKNKGKIVIDFRDTEGNERFAYAHQLVSVETPQAKLKESVSRAGEALKKLNRGGGEDIPGLVKQGVDFDRLVDHAVKLIHAAIDKGVEINEAIKQVIKDLKESKLYAKLAADKDFKADEFEKNLTDRFMEDHKTYEERVKQSKDFTEKQSPEQERKSFIDTVKGSEKTTEGMKKTSEDLDEFYKAISNKETLKKADKQIREDLGEAKKEVLSDSPADANKSAMAVRLIKHYESIKDYDSAIDILDVYDKQLREAGRFIQAASMWNKLSPETMVRNANKAFRKITKKEDLPKGVQKVILEKMQEIDKMPEGDAKTKATLDMLSYIADQMPLSFREKFDAYRYQNMLSNPRSHERNIYANLLNTFLVRSLDIAATGTYDLLRHPFNPAAREYKLANSAKYMQSAVNAIPMAWRGAIEAFKQGYVSEKIMDIGDTSNMIEAMRRTKLPKYLTVVSRLMESQDRFFSTIIAEAEKVRLMKNGLSEAEATIGGKKIGETYLYRDKLGVSDASKPLLVRALDKAGAAIIAARKEAPILSWVTPFITTPINVAKFGVERSPLGFIGGSYGKIQVANATIGTLISGAGAMLAMNGKTTWGAPRDKKEKALFYASGRKPYSVQIGDKWVPLQYFGPYALALALPAAYKNFKEDTKTAPTDEEFKVIGDAVMGAGGYIAQQTPLSGLAGFFKALDGEEDFTFWSTAAFTSQQALPLIGLVKYVNSIYDPIYRKATGTDPKTGKKMGYVEAMEKDLPGLSQDLPGYPTLNKKGKEDKKLPLAEREPMNYWLPYDVGMDEEAFDILLKERRKKLQEREAKKDKE